MGTTLRSGANFGGVSNLGGGSTFGSGVRMGMESTLGGCYGTFSGVVGTGGEIYEANSGFQDPKRLHSLAIAPGWLWYALSGA